MIQTYQYIAGAIVSLVLSVYLLLKKPKTFASKLLICFGLSISMWEFFSFLYMTAQNEVLAGNFFRFLVLSCRISYLLFLLTFLNVPKKRDVKSLMLVILPSMVHIAAILSYDYLSNFQFLPTESGWTQKLIQVNYPLAIDSAFYIISIIATAIGLLALIKKTRFPLLRRKYTLFLVSFLCFQLIGIFITNLLTTLGLLPSSFHLAGVFHVLSFISLSYTLTLKEDAIPLSFKGKDFSQVYSSFLTVYYNSVHISQLGERAFEFEAFVDESKISDLISFNKDDIQISAIDDVDIEALVNRNLNTFKKRHMGDVFVDYYLRVLNMAHHRLDLVFSNIVRTNLEFLKGSDLIYGVSGGALLKELVEDNSLNEVDDVAACLKIYKRILLSFMDEVQGRVELRDILSSSPFTEDLVVTEFGEVSLNGAKDRVLSLPEDQRLSTIIDNFNTLIRRVFEDLLSSSNADISEALGKLKLVLALNKERAIELGVYPTLLGALAARIPRSQTHELYYDYLEEMVQEKTKALEEAHGKLLDVQRLAAIGEAAAMVGHDLRNPLQVVTYALYFAEKNVEASPHSDLHEALGTIKEQVKYMNKIVSDLQDYARPLKPKLVGTSLPALINETLSTLTIPNTVQVSLCIEDAEDSLTLMTDELMMKRVFINLITNALQAMPEGGQLIISVTTTDENAVIRIQDTGVGIPEEQMSKLFQPLFTTKAKGQGLGLTVCKRLIEANDGQITFTSKLGVGSTFTVTLPLILNTIANQQELNQSIVTTT